MLETIVCTSRLLDRTGRSTLQPGAEAKHIQDMTSKGPLVGELASRYVISVEATAPIRTVIEHFVEGGVGFVVALESGSVAGVVGEHDVVRAIHDGADIDEIWAADIMSTDLVTADAAESVDDVARLMVDNRVRHVLVLGDEGGVVSIRDVLDAMVRPPETATTSLNVPVDPAAHARSAARVDFHLRAAIGLGAVGNTAEATSETALALSLFELGGFSTGRERVDLPSPSPVPAEQRDEILHRSRALARQLQAHYVSEGQHDLADLYESAATNLDSVLSAEAVRAPSR